MEQKEITVGIMQPYFFPYIGYFQLIQAVDTYVNLDHVSFMKRSYMVRNTLKNSTPINIPCLGASQNKSCVEVKADASQQWFDKFFKITEQLYKKEPNYQEVCGKVLVPWRDSIRTPINYLNVKIDISEFNLNAIILICKYLDIDTKSKFIDTSVGITDQKKEKGLQEIVKYYDGTHYINAIGGQSLYNKENFANTGIDLKFIKMGDVQFDNPYSSILDLLFRYDKEHIKQQLNNYILI